MTNYITAAGVQQFTITIASGSTTGTVNLGTAVGTGAFINYGGINPSVTTNFTEAGAYLSWATSVGVTTITATRNTGTTGTVVINGSITDGNTTNLVKTVQQGTVAISASTSGTASVSAPSSDANTAIHFLGDTGTGTTLAWDTDFTTLTQSGTTVTANVPVSGTTTTGFCLIEFQSTPLTANAVQRVSATSSSNVTSYTASFTNVVLANTVTFYGGSSIATVTTNPATGSMRGALSGVGTLTVNINTGSANAKTYNVSIVEFNAGVLNSSVQRGTTTLTGVTLNTTAITNVNETYSGISWLSNTATATTAQLGESLGNVAFGSPLPSFKHASEVDLSSSGSAGTITSTTAGSLLVAVFNFLPRTATITSVTDSKGQTWVQVSGAQATDAGSSNTAMDIWYFPNSASGVTTVTPTGSGITTSSLMYVVHEWGNAATSSPVDGTGAVLNSQATSTSQLTPQITTAAAYEIIIGGVSGQGTATITTVNAPYTFEGGANAPTAYYNPTTTVTNSQATFTALASTTYCSTAAAFKPSSAEAIAVNKATATANITGSWEVFEFPAFSSAANTVTETVTESDSETILATDVVSFIETQTETDSYTSAYYWTNTLSETQTESDSVIILATDKGLDSESNTSNDLIAGAATSITNLNETGTASDTHQGIASGLGLFTENNSISDSYSSSQTQPGSNTVIEIVTESDSVIITATDSDIISELVAANDNYDSQLIPAPSITTVSPATGSGDGPWKRYLLWLERKKRKQFKRRAEHIKISVKEAEKIAEVAAIEVKRQEIELKTPYYAILRQNEQLARHAAQIAINQIYEAIWEARIREAIRKQREDEEEFFMMMM